MNERLNGEILSLTRDVVDLNVDDLGVEELERRLELAIASAWLDSCGTNACHVNDGSNCDSNTCHCNDGAGECGSNGCSVNGINCGP